jgi:hypothetical protein
LKFSRSGGSLVYAAVGKVPQKLDSRGRVFDDVWSQSWSSIYDPAGNGELKSASSNVSSSGNGLIGLSEMFSLNAVERGKLLTWSVLSGSRGIVSDLFILFLTLWYREVATGMFPIRCLLVEAGGVGSRVAGVTLEGLRLCESEGIRDSDFLCRVGNGRLLKVRLRGMPPMGSSGRHM